MQSLSRSCEIELSCNSWATCRMAERKCRSHYCTTSFGYLHRSSIWGCTIQLRLCSDRWKRRILEGCSPSWHLLSFQTDLTSHQYRRQGFYRSAYDRMAYTAYRMRSWNSCLHQLADGQWERRCEIWHPLIDNWAPSEGDGKWVEYWQFLLVCSLFWWLRLSIAGAKLEEEELVMGKVRVSAQCMIMNETRCKCHA